MYTFGHASIPYPYITVHYYRWGQRPYDDAIKFGQEHVASYLEKYIDKEILECITP